MIIEYSAGAVAQSKGQFNALGANYAQVPYPDEPALLADVQLALGKLSDYLKPKQAVRGEIQVIVSENRQLYFIENNARPPACMVWAAVTDPWAMVRAWINQDQRLLASSFIPSHQYFATVAVLLQQAPAINIDLQWVAELSKETGVQLSPYSLVDDGQGIQSVSGRLPSLLWLLTSEREQAVSVLDRVVTQLKARFPFL